MFEREMMINGIEKQRRLLAHLIREIENKPALGLSDWGLLKEGTGRVASNLRKLRDIKADYFSNNNPGDSN